MASPFGGTVTPDRDARYYDAPETRPKRGSRTPAQRDRDRLIYTSALRRLAGVTQVVGPLEGHVFHNRLTHTLKVAQVAKRLAERLALQRKRARALGGIDPEVVEAAALAHDLGHPPFGHIAEKELDRLVRSYGDDEGYEGNAQSFRIVTQLAAHREEYGGLNLTGATLNAILKYPWPRLLAEPEDKRYEKFGYYSSEERFFTFAREGYADDRQSVEAAIMDVADAITYSVHDLDDFFRAGLVPLHLLRHSPNELAAFLDAWKRSLKKGDSITVTEIEGNETLFENLLEFWPTDRQHVGSRDQRRFLRWATSRLIDRYVTAVRLNEPTVARDALEVPRKLELELGFLQRLVRAYVIDNPRLATQQAGQRRVIRTLYAVYYRAVRSGNTSVVPPGFVAAVEEAPEVAGEGRKQTFARVAADIVSSLSDNQANLLFRRFCGITPGSVSDLLEG